uniref:DZF domain-containing protein n=1 Tax=Caenorhabditis tropicalis TaxID=1561998 RepID=A0A1I7URG7_9PELO
MYNGYQGAYSAYGNQEYTAGYADPQAHQQPSQPYYTGVNPYANYGYGGGINAALQPPPPPPPVPPVTATWSTFPSTTTTSSSIASSSVSYFQKAQQPGSAGAYNGYDAAVYNYAQQGNHSNHPHQNNKWKPGGGGRQGRPTASTDNKQYYCETCKISCAGGITYKEHLEGQKHKKKEAEKKKGIPKTSLAKNKLTYRCELCEVTCTGQDTYQAHVRGKTHLKTQQLHRKLGRPIPEDVPTIIAPGEDGPVETKAKPQWHQQQLPGGKKVIGINTVQFVGGYKLNSTGRLEEKKREVALAVGSAGQKAATIEVEDERLRAMMAAEEVKPIGEEHVVDERDATGKLIQYRCKICECQFSDPNAKEIHVKGRRHRLSYKQKIDPSFVVDPKPNGKKSEKGKRGGGGFEQGIPMWNGPLHAQPAPEYLLFNIQDDRIVQKKLELIIPDAEHVASVDCLVENAISAFRAISDRFFEEEMNAAEKERIVCGCVRVGIFSTATYLKEETLIELVATCTVIPTKELAEKVLNAFQEANTTMSIEMDPECPMAFNIIASSTSDLPKNLKIHVAFTSSAFANRNSEEIGIEECPDVKTCLRALTELRRAKWFDNHCRFLNSCQQTVRLFRDARSRHPTWKILEDHVKILENVPYFIIFLQTLNVLVANIINSSPALLSFGEAFRRVLEAISAGFLYSANLNDPCEPGSVNVLDALTDEQKHELTASAQFFIRKLSFNQIHEILGMEEHDVITVVKGGVEESPMLKRTMELISGFNGEKLPDLGGWQNSEDADEEPMLKRARGDEGAEPMHAEEAELLGTAENLANDQSDSLLEAEPMMTEGAEPMPAEEEHLLEEELLLIEGSQLPTKSAEEPIDPTNLQDIL